MKNTSLKVVILICSCAIAITAITAFIITKAKAPDMPEVKNLHKITLAEAINKFDTSAKESHNEAIYLEVADKFALYRSEEFLTEEEFDSLKVPFMNNYVPIFTAACNAKFSKSVWSSDDHKAMTARIAELKKLYSSALTSEHLSEFSKIHRIIKTYNDAWNIAKSTGYSSNDKAKATIKKSEEYLNTSPINNCDALVKKLRALPNAIGKSHYNKVNNLLTSLENYSSMDEDSWDKLYDNVDKAISSYEEIENSYKFNEYKYTAEALREKKNTIKSSAKSYFEAKQREVESYNYYYNYY
jgi:hypothetical protein